MRPSRDTVSLLTPGFWGDGLTRTYMLAQTLRAAGCGVEVVGCVDGHGRIYPEPPPDLALTPVPLCDFPRLAGRVCRAVRGEVIYAVKPYPTSLGIGLWARMRLRRPLLVDIDDWVPGLLAAGSRREPLPLHRRIRGGIRQLRQPRSELNHRLAHRLIRHADAVTVNTRFLQAHYGGVYLPSGKDPALYDPARHDPEAARAALGLRGHRVLMFPGTVLPHKGVEDLLTAMEMLAWPDLRLALVGGRQDGEPHVARLCARWGRWIVRVPPQPAARMPEVIAAAHLIVAPQRETAAARAQFPMKLTDAMAMAKPILATRVGDIPEVLGGDAYLVAPGAPAALAAAIESAFSDYPAAVARGQRARGRFLRHYSVNALGARLAGVIDALRGRRFRYRAAAGTGPFLRSPPRPHVHGGDGANGCR